MSDEETAGVWLIAVNETSQSVLEEGQAPSKAAAWHVLKTSPEETLEDVIARNHHLAPIGQTLIALDDDAAVAGSISPTVTPCPPPRPAADSGAGAP